MKKAKVLLVGCGFMGGALKKGWESTKVPFDIVVIDPSSNQYVSDIDTMPKDFIPDLIVFAVKPQALPDILPLYLRFSGKGCLFVTIAAGVSLETYHIVLGTDEKIIRAMPNLAVQVGEGITALVSRSALSEQHKALGQSIFEASGTVIWLNNENLMDVVTAVSGSGPAYFFRLVECLASAGAACGLPPDVALTLARQTAIGAGTMLQNAPDSPTDLRVRVTSPGGTTAAALSTLDLEDTFAKLIRTAVRAAVHRGQELAQ